MEPLSWPTEIWGRPSSRRSVLTTAAGLAAAATLTGVLPGTIEMAAAHDGHELFPGFDTRELRTTRGELHARIGGTGPALLLMHGYPQSHLIWHAVAPMLAERFTVVATDLPGYGDSFKPPVTEDHSAHSKRAMATDHVDAMAALGFDRFLVVGHDRGGRVGYRMALDHPDTVARLAVLDIIPTSEVWRRADRLFARFYWHWGFLALPAPAPERMIIGDPDAFFATLRAAGLGAEADRYPATVMRAYRAQFDSPAFVQAVCEDYRAGALIDVAHDDADHDAGRRIKCPLLSLWGTRGALPAFYKDVLAVWRDWADDVSGQGVDASHFLPEDRPEEVAGLLEAFLSA